MAEISVQTRFIPGEFRIGGVFSRSFAVYSAHFATFFLLGAVSALPALLIYWSELIQSSGRPASATTAILLVVAGLLGLIIGPLVQAAILYGAFQDMRGRRVSIGESLDVALRRFFPVLGVAICVSFAIGIGIILLIVPGLIFASMFFVAAPACVVERLGPFKSMRRSRELTAGHRWKVFGLLLLLTIVNLIVVNVLKLGLGAMAGPILALIALLIWGALYGGFSALIAVVSYHDLRVAKEGIDIEQIAAVFD
jgi:MFS family permease